MHYRMKHYKMLVVMLSVVRVVQRLKEDISPSCPVR